jgi:hypothetical protein
LPRRTSPQHRMRWRSWRTSARSVPGCRGTSRRNALGLADWWASSRSSPASRSRGEVSRPSLGEVIACCSSALASGLSVSAHIVSVLWYLFYCSILVCRAKHERTCT